MSSRESSLERDHAGREDSRGPFLQDVVILPVAVNQQPLERQDPIVNLEERSPPDILPSSRAKVTESTVDMGEYNFYENIEIEDADSKLKNCVALIDTQCQDGIWVSLRVVEDLGKAREISQVDDAPSLLDASSNIVEICGTVSLRWKWSQGNRVNKNQFYVSPKSHFDVIIGTETIQAMKLVSRNRGAFLMPMIAHKRETDGERVRIASLEEQQRQDKAALEAQRQASQQAQQQKNGQSSQAQSQQTQRG